ncbi:hypothetical protein BBK82_14215 [Lentzea guizhouensis]|uniref:Flagellar basal body-associated protein FliL n=1 Tax=Lentzea guizhouensis TaxID=1586287 RepID=A0A1B2HH50_9PSEU|nr:hypothetical protein [Lentzea guizhouensis]ANZ37052.1 hypothetical protein BBK82_14215 [Lentzea guizhouensis]
MSWQDELQKLDAELASGRVSADEYRQRRDAILAGNTGAGAGAPAGGSFPPPVRWQAVPPPEPEKTQYIAPVQPPAQAQPQQNSDKTQVVSVNGGGQQQQQQNPDATQVVPGSGGFPQPNYGGGQFPQAGGWQQQGGGAGAPPPWVTDQDSYSTPSWNQGPEVFDSAAESSGKGKKIIGIVIVVLLVVGLGVAGFFFFTSKKDNEAQTPTNQTSTSATPTSKPVPEPPAQKPDAGATADSIFSPLPGTERPGGGQFDLARMAAQKLMTGKTTEALNAGAMTEATLSTTIDGKNTVSIMAMSVADQTAAGKVVAAYFQDQAALKENKDLGYKGVKVVTDPAKKVMRAAYVYYNKAVIVEVFTSDGGSVEESFKELLKNQLEFAPPTVR